MALNAPAPRRDQRRTRAHGERPPRTGADLITELSETWREAARAATIGAVIDVVTERARISFGAVSASITLGPDRRNADRPLKGGGSAAAAGPSVAIPIVTDAGKTVGVLRVTRAPRKPPFSADDEVVLGAFALIAAVRTDELMLQRNVQAVLDYSPAAIFLKDSGLRYILANRRAAELVGLTSAAELLGRRDDEMLPAADAALVMASDQSILDGRGDVDEEQPAHWPLVGREFHVHAFGVRDEDGETIGVGGVVSDITAHRSVQTALAASEERYRLLFEHALDAILVSDDAGRYVDANPSACQLFGLTREEILERSAGDIVMDVTTAAAAAPADHHADTDVGDAARYVRLRRPDGTTREAEFSTVADVAPGIHLSVFRDATDRRSSERRTQQREAILEGLLRLPVQAVLEDQADATCREIVATGFFPNAAIFALEPPRRLAILGAALGGAAKKPVQLPPTIEGERVAGILAKASNGAWVDDWLGGNTAPTRTVLDALGVSAVAWAPIRADDRVIALLAVGGSLPAVELTERLPDVAELASIVAGSALGRSLRERASVVASREYLRRVIDEGAFRPVFQAIVDLESGEPLGYEALTRFDDGTPPDIVFAQAAEAGLSLEMQIATAELAMHAAGPLPANRFIDINVSPELIVAREPLRSMLRAWGYGVVLEITEHVAVSDYDEVRDAISEIGDNVMLAVDDAGAGFALLRHILELRPAMVKLDRTLVAGIDGDPARQALVAGMAHFAARLEFDLIAEGVETQAERATLLTLGVRRAQGYLFGRPAPAATVARGS